MSIISEADQEFEDFIMMHIPDDCVEYIVPEVDEVVVPFILINGIISESNIRFR